MWPHSLNCGTDLCKNRSRALVIWVEYTSQMHQFLDCNRRMIRWPHIHQIVDDSWSAILHKINVDTRVEQQISTCKGVIIEKWQFIIFATTQCPIGTKSSPTQRGVKLEVTQSKTRVLERDRPCHVFF